MPYRGLGLLLADNCASAINCYNAIMNYEKLRQAVRNKAGDKTAKNLSLAIRVSESTLSRLLSGGSVTLETYERLCDWLGCSMDEFREAPVESMGERMLNLAARLEGYSTAAKPIEVMMQAIIEEFGDHD